MIVCNDLTFSYDSRKVIDHLSFSVEKGSLVCIVGENGAGKSTLVKGILGLKKPIAAVSPSAADEATAWGRSVIFPSKVSR